MANEQKIIFGKEYHLGASGWYIFECERGGERLTVGLKKTRHLCVTCVITILPLDEHHKIRRNKTRHVRIVGSGQNKGEALRQAWSMLNVKIRFKWGFTKRDNSIYWNRNDQNR